MSKKRLVTTPDPYQGMEGSVPPTSGQGWQGRTCADAPEAAEVLDVLQCLIQMAHDDAAHALTLLLALPVDGKPLTNRAIGQRLAACKLTLKDKYTPEAIRQRRMALVAEFPILAAYLTPGSGRPNGCQ